MSEEQKPLRTKVALFFKNIDIFASRIHIQIRAKNKISSPFGGFLSLVFIVVLIIPTVELVSQMVNHEKPKVAQVTSFEDVPGAVNLDQVENFIFAIGITMNGSSLHLNKSMLVINASMVTVEKMENKTKTITQVPLILRQCRPTDFLVEKFNQDVYLNYTLDKALCPDNLNFSISGESHSDIYKYILIESYACSKNMNSTEFRCEEEKTLKKNWGSGVIKYNFYFSNNNIDPQDFSLPNKSFFDSFFWVLSPKFVLSSQISINAFSIIDYISSFTSNTQVNRSMQTITPNGLTDNSKFVSISLDNLQKPLLSIKLQRSSYHSAAYRTYLGIGDILGYIGGLASPILIFLSLFSRGYTNRRIEVEVANSLYDIKTSTKRSEIDKKAIELMERRLTGSPEKTRETGLMKTHVVAAYFKRETLSRKNINHGPLEYMKLLVPFWADQDEKLKENAFELATRELNVINVLKDLAELDKIKAFALNPYQQELFDFFARGKMPPEMKVITKKEMTYNMSEIYESLKMMYAPDCEEDPVVRKLLKNVKLHVGRPKIVKLYSAYRIVKKDNNPFNKKLNKRLLKMIEDDNLLDDFQNLDRILESEK